MSILVSSGLEPGVGIFRSHGKKLAIASAAFLFCTALLVGAALRFAAASPCAATSRSAVATHQAGSSDNQAGWTQWRGPGRDGSVSGDARAGEWPARLAKLWEREVGEGYSGPVVAGDRIWVHAREGRREVVMSLTLGGGETVWRAHYEAPFQQDHDAQGHGRGPYATPSLAGGRLFTLGVTSVLSAWDAETGGLLWRRDYAGVFSRNYPYFGMASSPLVWGDLCFVHFGGMGWEERETGAMVALDVADGRERWRWNGDAPSCGASPVIHRIGDRPQLVFKTKENIVAVDPGSGAELWRTPYRVPQFNTIVTPLFIGNVLVTSDWEMGAHAWRIESTAGSWSARKLWQTRAASMFLSSPVLIGGEGDARAGGPGGGQASGHDAGRAGGRGGELVVGFSHLRSGQLFGLDPNTGEVLWQGPGRAGEHASLIAWGDELLAFMDDGSLIVGQVSREGFRPLRTYRLGRSGLMAHPAIAGDRIILRDGTRLAVYSFGRG